MNLSIASFKTFILTYDEVFSTLFLFIFAWFVFRVVNIFIKKQDWTLDKKRSASIVLKNFIFIFILLSFIFTWKGEIKTFIFSVSAIAAALMVSLKEIVLSVVSYFIIYSNKIYNIGDYIEVDGIVGKVIDKNMLHTRLLIQDNLMTGKEVNIPNMVVMNSKIINHSTIGEYGVYFLNINIPIEESNNLIFKKKKLLEVAQKNCSPFLEDAKKHFYRFQNNQMIDLPNVEPFVFIDLSDSKTITLKLKFISNHKNKYKLEQKIIEDFFS